MSQSVATTLRSYWELTKPRITALVVFTAWLGYALASRQSAGESASLVHLCLGTWLAAAGASAFNQYVERDLDAKMVRTQNRPLPSGRLSPRAAFLFSGVISLCGVVELTIFINPLCGLLAALTIAIYLGVYTPAKRRSSLCTLIGAIPGAIPPLIGWAAVRPTLGWEAWALFGILFLWQLPHFLAIAILYRDDYARAGFPMLSVTDRPLAYPMMILYSAVLVPVTLLPFVFKMTGVSYAWAAVFLGAALLWISIWAARHQTPRYARMLLIASVLYLPALLAWMALA